MVPLLMVALVAALGGCSKQAGDNAATRNADTTGAGRTIATTPAVSNDSLITVGLDTHGCVMFTPSIAHLTQGHQVAWQLDGSVGVVVTFALSDSAFGMKPVTLGPDHRSQLSPPAVHPRFYYYSVPRGCIHGRPETGPGVDIGSGTPAPAE